jgi:dihydropyrimidinase
MERNTRPPLARIRALAGALALVLLPSTVAAQQPAELIVRNGTIVTATGRMQADLRIRNGVVAEIGRALTPGAGARVIDAAGKLVLPGGIDPHVHMTLTRTATTAKGADDFTSASRAALAGGITTIGTFIDQNPEVGATTTLTQAMELANQQAIADGVLHYTVSDPTKITPADVAFLYDKQVTLKIFMVRPAFDANAAANVELIRQAGRAGVLTMLHAEDSGIIGNARAVLTAQGRTKLVGRNFSDAGPVVAEEVATKRAIGISEQTGAPIFLVHMSSERAMRAAEDARARGLPVFTEVRFIYLHLTEERFEQPDGQIYTGAPPLRTKDDQNYLWGAMARGSVDVVDTDHVGYTREEKMDPENSITRSRNAANYLQDQMPLLMSEGVRKGRITLEQMVDMTATKPAKLFGLYPRKGTIAVGSDGDVVIWDPQLTRTIRDEDILSNGKFSIFNGWELTGWPVVTIRRGEVVYENGRILGAPGSGRLAPRTHWERP